MLSSAESSLRENQRACFQPGIGESRSAPAKGSPPSPFIVVRRGGAHEWGVYKSSFSLESRGTVVEHCRKCTVGRRRTSLSTWISSLVLWRWRRPSCSVPAVVMARGGPGPPGRSAGAHIRRSGSVWKSRTPQEGGPGSRPRMQSAPHRQTPSPAGDGLDGGSRQNSNGGGANSSGAAFECPQCCYSDWGGRAVTGVSGRDAGHIHCGSGSLTPPVL